MPLQHHVEGSVEGPVVGLLDPCPVFESPVATVMGPGPVFEGVVVGPLMVTGPGPVVGH